ncbi:MAG: pilin [Candidatus Paceibacterota bacterium]
MKYKKVLLIAGLVFISLMYFSPVLALEIKDYPTINNITLPPNPSLSQYIIYIFNLCLNIGVLLGVFVLIFGGFQFFFSRGEIGKVESSKRIIVRSLAGLVVLLGAISILSFINGQTGGNIGTSAADHVNGIVVLQKNAEGGTDDEIWWGQDISLVDPEVTSIKQWISKSDELPRILVYPEPDFKGVPTVIVNGSTSGIGAGKSIVFEWNRGGVYLYDQTNFLMQRRTKPLILTASSPSLGSAGFSDVIKSVKVMQPQKFAGDPDEPLGYGAILFTESDYRGQCTWVIDYVSDLKDPNGQQNLNPADKNKGIGNDKVSSVFVFRYRTKDGQPVVGEPEQAVTFYNAAICTERGAQWNPVKNELMPGKCDYADFFQNGDLSKNCGNMSSILSINMGEKSLVLLRDKKNGQCQLFQKSGATSCISTVKYGYAYKPDVVDLRPFSFTLFPFDTIQSAK